MVDGKWEDKVKKIMKDIMKNKITLAAFIVLIFMALFALLGPTVLPYSPTEQKFETFSAPSVKHPMGTDDLGRDVLSRVITGSRISLMVGFLAVAIAFGLGLLIGSISGYLGGFIDSLFMRIVDIFLAFPYVLGALALMVLLGAGTLNVVIAISAFMWASFARLQRASVMEIKEAEYVEAAKLSGAKTLYMIWRHILPNTVGPLIVYAATGVGTAILGEAVLSFIQIGIQPPTPSLGLMLGDALSFIDNAPWLMLFPGAVLLLIVSCCVVIGDSLRDMLDPAGGDSPLL